MKIHPNKKSAIAAIEEYKRELNALSERTGVYDECEDSCCGVYTLRWNSLRAMGRPSANCPNKSTQGYSQGHLPK